MINHNREIYKPFARITIKLEVCLLSEENTMINLEVRILNILQVCLFTESSCLATNLGNPTSSIVKSRSSGFGFIYILINFFVFLRSLMVLLYKVDDDFFILLAVD